MHTLSISIKTRGEKSGVLSVTVACLKQKELLTSVLSAVGNSEFNSSNASNPPSWLNAWQAKQLL